jgi:protein-S-isoprenylcysteine O-methyltransferase Ste14
MRDFGEYLRAYWAYVLANLGWGKALSVALVWLAGMFAPLVAKTLLELPNWMAMTWMIVWAVLGYIFAPYGMWKHHRAQTANVSQPDQKQARELVGKNRVDRFRP